jgi:hypothetical protein
VQTAIKFQQPPVQCILVTVPPRVKWLGHETHHLVPQLRTHYSIYTVYTSTLYTPSYCLHRQLCFYLCVINLHNFIIRKLNDICQAPIKALGSKTSPEYYNKYTSSIFRGHLNCLTELVKLPLNQQTQKKFVINQQTV